MKTILLIATGGTIASKKTELGLTPQITSEEILSYVPEIKEFCQVEAIQLFNLDSSNICHRHWIAIAQCIKEHYESYDGFVITHGTDTMAYTSAALSYMIQNSKKAIVLTGSQKSIYMKDTDARTNLKDAFVYAADERSCGVHIVFNGKVILGTRARKTKTKSFNAFDSVNYPEVAIIRDNRLFYFVKESIEQERPEFHLSLNPNVFVLKMIPGIKSNIFDFLYNHYDGLIIESFGVGGLPQYEDEDFLKAIKQWSNSGKVVIMTTQVMKEGSDMQVYEIGYAIKKQLGLMEAYDMTTEAVVTKLMWLLGETKDIDQIQKEFYKSVQKDILYWN